ncbi:MAG: AMP-dependent synthetase and ligase [Bryobacterales bacterium]|nr:AMP-dependent synthetase and ligase [Bryobacterales bacterium]
MPLRHKRSLWSALAKARELHSRFIADEESTICLSTLAAESALYGRGDELRGLSVLVDTTSQIAAAAALIELDGIARRIVLCTPDLADEHVPFVMEAAGVNAIVSNRPRLTPCHGRHLYLTPCSKMLVPTEYDRTPEYETEWVLLTSGTMGRPKLVVHTLESLAGAIADISDSETPWVWSTFYDIRRYGGLQILLRAILTGTSLVLSGAQEPMADFLARASLFDVTHISGTPSHWRRALMSPAVSVIDPVYVRLSGEVADQTLLTHLRDVYPKAKIAVAFASTEAGVVFEVNDGLAGFPVSAIDLTSGVDMQIRESSLRVRSDRTATRYLGDNVPALKDAHGYVDTADLVEKRGSRYHFVGRRDGVINVGGLKVYPEEIESVINRHPEVEMSMVRMKRSPITGSLVIADVVLKETVQTSEALAVQDRILMLCRKNLSSHKVPAAINFVPALAVAGSGKMIRPHA